MRIREIVSYLDSFAPPGLQESYDNAGLILGDPEQEASGALLTVDVTEEVVKEAAEKKLNLIVAHHPLIFSGLKKITGADYIQRAVILALSQGIAVYAAHTNLDIVEGGVNTRLCEKIGLSACRVLKPIGGKLRKLVCFVPSSHLEKLREALFAAGAGHIGKYDSCAFQCTGEGTFRALPGAKPFVGKPGELHTEKEVRLETIFPHFLERKIIQAMKNVHPYEEVAYDVYLLENEWTGAGMGMVGRLDQAMKEGEFLLSLKEKLGLTVLRHTPFLNRDVHTVAVCGGSGSSLLKDAIRAGAGVFVSADFKYHQFFEAERKIMIADIGHFESEQFTKEIFYELISKKFPTFAVQFSAINTNPVNYL